MTFTTLRPNMRVESTSSFGMETSPEYLQGKNGISPKPDKLLSLIEVMLDRIRSEILFKEMNTFLHEKSPRILGIHTIKTKFRI